MKFLPAVLSFSWYVQASSSNTSCSSLLSSAEGSPSSCPGAISFRCMLAGEYTQAIPQPDKNIVGFFERLQFNGSGGYTLVRSIHCPNLGNCPKTLIGLNPISGSYDVSDIRCPQTMGASSSVNFTIALNHNDEFVKSPIILQGSANRNSEAITTNQVTLVEKTTLKSHLMIKS